MRNPSVALAALATVILAVPASAQSDDATIGFFVRVQPQNVEDFEENVVAHSRWHRDQNDPHAWPTYQAMTGPQLEYVTLSTLPWSDFDTPAVDPAADLAHFASSAARYAESVESSIWTAIPNSGSPPANPLEYPIVQVIEFEINSGGEGGLMAGIRAFKAAVDAAGADLRYGWSMVQSADGPPAAFVAIWARSFAELGAPGPTPIEILSAAVGPAEAGVIADAFSRSTTTRASRIWTLRPDLSYIPN